MELRPPYAGGTLYDAPSSCSTRRPTPRSARIEALYSIKVNLPTNVNRTDLWIDVFRYNSYGYDYRPLPGRRAVAIGSGDICQQLVSGVFQSWRQNFQSLTSYTSFWIEWDVWGPGYSGNLKLDVTLQSTAEHIGRAVFDGRFEALRMRRLAGHSSGPLHRDYLSYAQAHYGHDAEKLTELSGADGDLNHDAVAGAQDRRAGHAADRTGLPTGIPLNFTTTASPTSRTSGRCCGRRRLRTR